MPGRISLVRIDAFCIAQETAILISIGLKIVRPSMPAVARTLISYDVVGCDDGCPVVKQISL